MTKEIFKVSFAKLNDVSRLNRLSIFRLWLLSLVITVSLAEALGVSLEWLMNGSVQYDYLLTMFVFALLASSVVGAMFITLLDKQAMEPGLDSMNGELFQQQAGCKSDDSRVSKRSEQQRIALANKQCFLTHLDKAIAISARTYQYGALLSINLGECAGLSEVDDITKDLLAQQIIQRLTSCIRKSDTVMHLDNVEFAVLLEGLGDNEAQVGIQAKKISEQMLAKLNAPLQLNSQKQACFPNIGIAVFGDQATPSHLLFKSACLAMYQAVACGVNNVQFFDTHLQELAQARARLAREIEEGLADKQFMLYYEAQVDSRQRIVGLEAVPRWCHRHYSELEPQEITRLAEESGLGFELGNWALTQACIQLAFWSKNADTAYSAIAVKVSAHQFANADFIDGVLDLLRETGADPRKLKLEFSEDTLVDAEQAAENLSALRDAGIRVTLDNFGKAATSFSLLREPLIDEIKIDPALVKGLTQNPADTAIVKAIVAIGLARNVPVIATGVKEPAQYAALADMGCPFYQGYYKTVPQHELHKLVTAMRVEA